MTWGSRSETLTSVEADQLALNLAELGRTGLPLSNGMRAAASEVPAPRVSRALNSLAEVLESGNDLNGATLQQREHLPKCLRGYIAAAARSGNFGSVLQQLVEQHQARREIRATIRSALAYPLLVLLVSVLLMTAAALFLIDDFDSLYREFGLELPWQTWILFWFGKSGKWYFVGVVALSLFGPALTRCIGGHARWHRLRSAVPVLGPLWHWSGVAELSRVLAVLLEHGIELPEALRLAADAVENANVGEVARGLAEGVERGESLSMLLSDSRRLPPSLVPIVAWGEQTGSLEEAFQTAATLFEERVSLRASVLRSVLPACAYLLVASLIGFFLVALISPLYQLIGSLSGGFMETPAVPKFSLPWLFPAAIPLGAVLLFCAVLKGRRSEAGRRSANYEILLVGGWILVLGGAVVSVSGFTMFSIPATIVVGVVAAATAVRFQRAERRSLLLAIAIAAERGIPLPQVIESFVTERTIGPRARHVANLLTSGVPLREAVFQSKHLLSHEAALAVDLGTELGDLGESLRAYINQTDQRESDLRWALDKLFYVAAIALVSVYLVTFLALKIVPTFREMYLEYELELPRVTQLVMDLVESVDWIAPLIAAPMIAVGFLAVLSYVGFFPSNLPVIRRLTARYQGARVMQYLGLAVRHERSLDGAMRWLADRVPNNSVSARLNDTAARIEQGRNAWDSLQSVGLIKRVDATVLKAAEKVGNLDWALEEMSASSNRRFAVRVRAAVNVLFPAVLLFLGFCVLFIAVAMFLPMVDLLGSLS